MKQLQAIKAARRILLAAAVATTATFTANAALIYWTGATDNDAGTASNWDANRFPTNDDAFFTDSGTYTDNEVVFNGAYTNSFRTYINGVGTPAAPLVFRATSAANGMQFSSSRNTYIAIDSAAYLQLESGTWSIGNASLELHANNTGWLTLTDGASFTVGTDIFLNNAASKVIVQGGAHLIGNRYFCLRNGEVSVENGTITVVNNNFELGQYAAVTLNLNEGGVLDVKQIVNKPYGGTVVLNGGEIKAAGSTMVSDSDVIVVKVGANGGAINANSRNITFNRPIAADGANDGGMTFKGGGSVTLKYANTYTGSTKVELGTKIIATTADAKNSVLGNLAVTGVAADGDYYVFEYSGLTDADVSGATITHSGAAGTTITRDGDQIKIHYVAPAVDLGWNGGNAAWATANAWTNATGTAKTWTDSNYAVFEDSSTVTLGADASALSATFNADATIAAGGGTLTVPAVTVASGAIATINAPTAGALEKDGAGTLTLGSSRSDATTLSEGTLVMAPGATLAALTLGTDAAKPVTFDYGGQTYSTSYTLNDGLDVTLTNCTFSSFSRVANGTVHVAKGATAWISGWLTTGPGSELTDTAAVLDICGGVVSNVTRNVSLGDHGELGATSVVRVRNGGLFTTGNGIVVGARAAATLTIDDGSVIVPYDVLFCQTEVCKVNEDCFVNLNAGGLLTARSITYGDGAANATFTFNGGTLRANQDYTLIQNKSQSRLSVVAAAGGGTIDAAGFDVTIEKTITGTGGMAYVGGGSVTYSVQPSYSGVTTVEVGTTLVVPSAIAGSSLAFTIPGELADGVYAVVSISGDSQFADDVLSGKGEGFVLSGDKKKICYVKGMDTTKPIYIGTDGNLSTLGNWLDGTVPTGGTGDAQIFCASAATLTAGATFRPGTITIPASSSVVTIADDLHVTGSLTNANKLAIASGASLTVDGDIVVCGDGKGTFLNSNEGTVTVAGNAVCMSGTTAKQYDVVTANTNPMRVGGFVFHRDAGRAYFRLESNSAGPGAWVVGANGFRYQSDLQYSELQWRYFAQANPVTLYSSANWTLRNSGRNGTTKGDLNVFASSSLTIDTSDYDDPTSAHTVTLEGRIMAEGPVTVTGCGTLEIATTGSHESLAEDYKHTYITNGVTLAVTDTATLQVNAGKKITGNGTISLAAGTTLALVSGGTDDFTTRIEPAVTLPTDGVATIRIDGARLSSGDHTILSNVTAGTTANVNLDMASAALDGRKASLAVDGSNLVLNIIASPGLMFMIK